MARSVFRLLRHFTDALCLLLLLSYGLYSQYMEQP
jgi:hypothetical protein